MPNIDIDVMDDAAPDVDKLVAVQKRIKGIYDLILALDEEVARIADQGPVDVLAPAATFYKMMVDVENAIEEVRLRAYHIKNRYQMIIMPDLFVQASTTKTSTLNGFTVSYSQDYSVSVPKDARPAAHEWLVEHGLGDIITETVNASTLKATLKEWNQQNKPMPPEELIKVTPIPKYSVVRASRKIPTA
jgi:hypothetical protein